MLVKRAQLSALYSCRFLWDWGFQQKSESRLIIIPIIISCIICCILWVFVSENITYFGTFAGGTLLCRKSIVAPMCRHFWIFVLFSRPFIRIFVKKYYLIYVLYYPISTVNLNTFFLSKYHLNFVFQSCD